MKQAEIRVGEAYAATAPDDGGVARYQAAVCKASVVATRQPREYSKKLDGVKVRLEEPWLKRFTEIGDGGRREVVARWLPVGHEYVVRSDEVLRPWGSDARHHDEDDFAGRARIKAQWDEADALFERLGLSRRRHVRYWRSSGQGGKSEELIPGYSLGTDGRARVDFDALLPWLRRIDPVEVAGDAIDHFLSAVAGEGFTVPDGGVRDRAKAATLEEVAQGVAVTDAELTP